MQRESLKNYICMRIMHHGTLLIFAFFLEIVCWLCYLIETGIDLIFLYLTANAGGERSASRGRCSFPNSKIITNYAPRKTRKLHVSETIIKEYYTIYGVYTRSNILSQRMRLESFVTLFTLSLSSEGISSAG